MKAMILAAGRGERMRPLTDTLPKPLLSIGTESLISRHIKNLAQAGFREIIINHAWLGQEIEDTLLDGAEFGVKIFYSAEDGNGLETAGGIATALPLLGDEPFLVINGDIFTNFDFYLAYQARDFLIKHQLMAYLWLTDNPPHHAHGDFFLSQSHEQHDKLTFTGMAIYHPNFFKDIPRHTRLKLAPLLQEGMTKNYIHTEKLPAFWLDVGTIDRLETAKKFAKAETKSL